ncbi:branched-chain amino acid ABC transporter permease [Halobacteriales archaeon QS_1_68_44]|nr:MAG: branched-chain amino acid ABC transporter permease [Halobacteriales archaeon QS_1_68_44]
MDAPREDADTGPDGCGPRDGTSSSEVDLTPSRRGSFLGGVRAVAPVLVGIIPFGLIAGAAAVRVGLSGLQAVGLSVVVFAGASQLAAIELLGSDARVAVVVATALVINLRMVMYSASIAPYFQEMATRWRAGLAYLLTDQAYALAVTRFGADRPVRRRWYYLGAALPLWAVWQVCTVLGVIAGARVPDSLPLSFAVPLTFLALLVPAVTDRASGTAAVVGGAAAVLGASLPLNLGLVAGAVGGVLAGLLVEPGWGR